MLFDRQDGAVCLEKGSGQSRQAGSEHLVLGQEFGDPEGTEEIWCLGITSVAKKKKVWPVAN